MSWDLLIFYYLAIVMIVSTVLAVFSRNPVYTVLLVLIMIVHQAFVLLTLGSDFLTAVQLIVYAGAVLVLFLFVVYLINLRKETQLNIFIKRFSLSFIIFLVSMFFLLKNLGVLVALKPTFPAYLPFDLEKNSNTWWIATYLFTNYLLQFEILGVILLVAIFGVVFLIRKVREVG
ncbi:MAG: NADH-quinone oxidoreductase subunit J [Thermodesulfobacteriaceae bacterium]|nr:NADH-quinone oxidoreductase subunit J [Thermodesulfobacteriaceae bacterium]MCX8040910.1 NADH-quinone oxidoreductase subunit J [Thermodesulfobacteriaceae bacterium]MDW8136221.1 NADH-quinone oxidoreductase subunit J [Thermodesulfobacterium sp.]